jgi:hypothetical protein
VDTLPGHQLSGSIFIINAVSGKRIEAFSALPSEEEVLRMSTHQPALANCSFFVATGAVCSELSVQGAGGAQHAGRKGGSIG